MKKTRKYQIAVNGEQKTRDLQPVVPHLYYIEAENEEAAIKRAETLFHQNLPDAVNVHAFENKVNNIVPIIFFSIAVLLSFIPWHTDNTVVHIRPMMITMISAVFLYGAVIIRIKGLSNSFNSVSETSLSCLVILFCSSFIGLFLGITDIIIPIPIPFVNDITITINGALLLFIGIALSWLGIPKVAKIVWIVMFILAVIRLFLVEAAMGFWGVVYVLSAFLGIVFMLKNESQDFRNSLGNTITNMTSKVQAKIFHDTGNVKTHVAAENIVQEDTNEKNS